MDPDTAMLLFLLFKKNVLGDVIPEGTYHDALQYEEAVIELASDLAKTFYMNDQFKEYKSTDDAMDD